MKIKILSVGKVKQSFILAGEEEYLGRMKSFARWELIEVPNAGEMPEAQMKKAEAETALAKVEKDEFLIVLDEHGKTFSSPDFAAYLQSKMNQGRSSFCFAIGGAYGWDEVVRKKADLRLSLSPMTFTYQMTRLILIEQLYRSMTILRGVSYHK